MTQRRRGRIYFALGATALVVVLAVFPGGQPWAFALGAWVAVLLPADD